VRCNGKSSFLGNGFDWLHRVAALLISKAHPLEVLLENFFKLLQTREAYIMREDVLFFALKDI
jgi:hypothetical protein